MGSGVSAGLATAAKSCSKDELKDAFAALTPEARQKLLLALREPEAAAAAKVQVFGMPVSQNVMGPVLLAMETGKGGLEMCNIMEGAQMKPEFLAMNPFHHIPTMKDGDVAVGESNAILRYLALKYKPEYYPTSDPAVCAIIDFAMDSFANEVYKFHKKTVYVVMGFVSAPEDQEAANRSYSESLGMWTSHFLKGRFVCGDRISIADFKAVPFLLAGMQPAVESRIGLRLPGRARQYVDDFCAAVASSGMLKAADGYSIVEFLASKDPEAKASAPAEAAELTSFSVPEPSGEVKVFGVPVSPNVMGPAMFAKELGSGGLEMCNIMEGEHMKPEFLAMNPFHRVPTMKHGDLAIGESGAILRYLALKHRPECYPASDPAVCATIDFAIDSFANDVYEHHTKTVYVVMGFASAPEDQKAANKKYTESLETWSSHFLKGKFVCGDRISIADYKVAPFLIAATQPAVESKIALKLPDRAQQYVKDFCDAVPSSETLKASLAELLPLPATKKEDIMGLIGARKEDDACLTFTYGSTSRLGGDGVATRVDLPGDFKLTIDEPEAFPGGTNAGPNPLDLMCASLGTCQEITYKLYATAMDIDLKSVSAKVSADINLSGFVGVGQKIGFSNIDVEITLDAPDASDEQLAALKGAVDAHCPLVATLVNPLDLKTNIVKAEAAAGQSVPQDNLKEGVMALVGAAKADANALKMKYGSTSILAGTGLMTNATITGGHSLVIDEPTNMPGGTNKGTNPLDLFCASFGSCQEITYKYYGQVMGVDVQSVSCKVEAPIDLGGLVGVGENNVGLKSMTATVTIESSASPDQLEALKAAVDAHCPLVDTLRASTPVNLTWKRAG